MADIIVLEAEHRERAGKGAARAARRAGLVPAILYGGTEPPQTINLPILRVNRLLRDPGFFTNQFELQFGDVKQRAMARDLQRDPVMDTPVHIDFLRVTGTTVINVEVPVRFLNEDVSPGLRRGGVLNVVRYGVELKVRADAIPEALEVDLAEAEINDSLHISAVDLPEGATPTITDRDFTIATIVAPSGLKSEADEVEEEDEEEVTEEED